jgi:uncharacterized protein YwgA
MAALFHQRAKGLRELQRAVGCSLEVFYQDPFNSLLSQGLVQEDILNGQRIFKLKDKGHKLALSLHELGQLPPFVMPKLRENLLVLFLVKLGSIYGVTRFMKLVFMHNMKNSSKMPHGWKLHRFYPWIYGPFSKELVNDLDELADLRFITVEYHPVRQSEFMEGQKEVHVYRLTPKGSNAGNLLVRVVSKDLVDSISSLDECNRMDLKKLLRRVYKEYPDWITESIIKKSLATED